jgi:hypothetical protein
MMLFYLLHHNVFDVTLADIFQCVNTDNMTRRDPKENVQLTDELYLSEQIKQHHQIWRSLHNLSLVSLAPPFGLVEILKIMPVSTFKTDVILFITEYKNIDYVIAHRYLINVRNPAWIETTVWLYLLYTGICHTVIHRKLQNVVYMKKMRQLLLTKV